VKLVGSRDEISFGIETEILWFEFSLSSCSTESLHFIAGYGAPSSARPHGHIGRQGAVGNNRSFSTVALPDL